jgi:hypothetical protein
MTSPTDVAAFYARFEQHPGDRIKLFGALRKHLPAARTVLYPGCFVDVAPSVWFGDVTYLDLDRRAARFFGELDGVTDLVASMRAAHPVVAVADPRISFIHQDYRQPLPLPEHSVDVLVSLYAGFVSEHCTRYLAVGGTLLVNPSHGDAAMADLDPRYQLRAVVTSGASGYRVSTEGLESRLIPRKPQAISVETLHQSGKGIAYTKPAFAYLFERMA